MPTNLRPVQFREYLPEVYRADEIGGISFLSRFLIAFESLFEELEAAIEGSVLFLNVRSVAGTTIIVEAFDTPSVDFPVGTAVSVVGQTLRGTLNLAIPANQIGLTQIQMHEPAFASTLHANDVLRLYFGGIPELFDPDTTPPPQFTHRPQPDFDYLNYLASWIALPLRKEKPVSFNRTFFDTAIPLYLQRSSLPGMDALLRAWLKGDLLENGPNDPPLLILTDLTREHNDIDAVFQLAPQNIAAFQPGEIYAQLGVNTSILEGAPFFFIVDLIIDPSVRDLRNPAGVDVFQSAARFLLDAEKPAHTYDQLRVRATTMQLAPELSADWRAGEIYAQFEDVNPSNPLAGTTMLWEEPWIFDSDC
jgi:hypothetical protein